MHSGFHEPHPVKMRSFILIACVFPICCIAQTYETSPVQNPGEDKIIVTAMEDDTDVSIYCEVTSSNIQTTWEVDGSTIDFDVVTGTGLFPYDYFSIEDDLATRRNLSIHNFTSDHDRLQVICRTGNIMGSNKIFLYGIPAGPMLDETKDVYRVLEGQDFFLDLSAVTNPFPPYNNPLVSIWTLDGQKITDDPQYVNTGDYNITLINVHRGLTGLKFEINVKNNIGSDSENFTLNVQYPPEASEVLNDSKVYAQLNGSAELCAVKVLHGNPYPNITWVNPNDAEVLLTDPRFAVPMDGTLRINNIQLTDFGEYLFAALNGIGDDLLVEVNLIEAVKPGEPENVMAIEIDSNSATIIWQPPNITGTPPFTRYRILVNMNAVETLSTKLEITGLLPGEMYEVTVRAISDYFVDGGVASDVTFTTDLTEPSIHNTTARDKDGRIVISYKLRHAGGVNSNEVSVRIACDRDSDRVSVEEASGYRGSEISSGMDDYKDSTAELSYTCLTECLDEDLSGSDELISSPLKAGETYFCSIFVYNSIGFDAFQIPSFESITGLPSIPIIGTNTENDIVHLNARSKYAGTDPTDERAEFYFAVTVVNNGVYVFNQSTLFLGYKSDTKETISFRLSRSGVYLMSVVAINKYGSSEIREQHVTVSIQTMPSPSTPTNSTARNKNIGLIVGGTVGGVIAIAIAIVTTATAAAVIVYMKKKGKIAPK